MLIESFLATVVDIQPFFLAQSNRLLYTMDTSQLQMNGMLESPAFWNEACMCNLVDILYIYNKIFIQHDCTLLSS